MDSPLETLNAEARAAVAAGRPAEAVALFARSLGVDPAQAQVMKELAAAAARAGARDQALRICEDCLIRTRDSATSQLRLMYILHSLGAEAAAVREIVALADRSGDFAACARALNNLMRGADPAAPETARAIRLLIRHGYAGGLHAPVFAGVLRHDPGLLKVEENPSDEAFAAADILADREILSGLAIMTVTDAVIERLFTRLRAAFLRHIGDDGALDAIFAPLRPALMALAQQCFANEYVWEETEADRAACARLAGIVEEARRRGRDLNLVRDAAAAVACFRPLLELPWAGVALITSPGANDPDWEGVLRRQVAEPLHERELAGRIEVLSEITDPVSRAVRDQYQEHPYPRWIAVSRAEPVTLPQRPGREPIPGGKGASVLVAGCGTGHHAIQVADMYPGARILAVDLSRASLGYALRKTKELGITSITYAQADILNLGRLQVKFDSIECGGVLHHLGDPAAGLRVLAGLLKPDGMMRLALYSRIARRAIIAAQELRAAEGVPGDLAGIRRFRRMVFALPKQHPAADVLLYSDMFSASECRDLVFHVQEICLDIPDLAALLRNCGLVFAGFDNLPRQIHFDYQATYPDDPGMMSLANWEAFERAHPNTFVNMYQFWAYKSPEDDQPSKSGETAKPAVQTAGGGR